MKRTVLAVVFLCLFAVGSMSAQVATQPPPQGPQKPEQGMGVAPKPAAPTPGAPQEKSTEKPPEVPPQVREAVSQMQAQATGYQRSMAILQKEIDAINAEYSRLLPQLQVPGWVLDQRTLTYTKQEPPKIAPPAPAAAPTTKK